MAAKQKEDKNEFSWAYQILDNNKLQNKRLFVLCILELIAIIGLVGYIIYDKDTMQDYDITSQRIEDVETIDNSSIINGGE